MTFFEESISESVKDRVYLQIINRTSEEVYEATNNWVHASVMKRVWVHVNDQIGDTLIPSITRQVSTANRIRLR